MANIDLCYHHRLGFFSGTRVVSAFCKSTSIIIDWLWPFFFITVPGSPRQLITRLAVQRAVEVGEQWVNFTHEDFTGAQLDYGYRVVCGADYYKPDCNRYCRPRDDKFGHYICNEKGEKVCMEGWEGQYCDQGTIHRETMQNVQSNCWEKSL